MSLDLSIAVLYHCSCVAPSLVKIGKASVAGDVWPGPGGGKRPGFGRGPGRTMNVILKRMYGAKIIYFAV